MSDWEDCEHEWKTRPGDWDDAPDGYSLVTCKLCGVPGERNDRDGSVHWPAT